MLTILLGPCLSLLVCACSGHHLAGDAETDSDPDENEPAEDFSSDSMVDDLQDATETIDKENRRHECVSHFSPEYEYTERIV
jgi:hypothetical protein